MYSSLHPQQHINKGQSWSGFRKHPSLVCFSSPLPLNLHGQPFHVGVLEVEARRVVGEVWRFRGGQRSRRSRVSCYQLGDTRAEAELLQLHCNNPHWSDSTNITESSVLPYRVGRFGDLQQLLLGSALSILGLSQILFQMIRLLQPRITTHINAAAMTQLNVTNNTCETAPADLLSDCSTSLTASCSASLIFCSISLFSSLVFMAVTSNLCLSCSASAALWAKSLASSSAIWAFSANRSAVSSDRSWRIAIELLCYCCLH